MAVPWTDNLTEFLGKNHDLPWVHVESGIQLQFTDQNGWITMAVVIKPDTRQKSFRNSDAWKFIEEWRERLYQWQGPWTRGGLGEFYYRLWLRYKTPQKIADYLNSRIAELISSGELDKAREILESVGFTHDKQTEWIEHGLPFPKDSPITRGRIQDQLKRSGVREKPYRK